MSDPLHRPLSPIITPSRSPSPTKLSLSRPLSLFGPSSSSSNSNISSSPAGGGTGLQRRPTHTGTHRSSASMSSISLSGLNLSGVGSAGQGHGMVHSPTFSPTSPLPGAAAGWAGFGSGFGAMMTMDKQRKVGAEHEEVQARVFSKWLNARLEPHYPPLTADLATDFMDGTRLIQLVEVLTDSSLGRYNTSPNHRVQRFENAKQALDRIKELGVHLTNIGAEDIVDGNRKLILGMIWSLVLRFSIADIQEEGTYAKEGLLLWCQRKTRTYEQVEVVDFRGSWRDGWAFCALIHRHRPDLLDWDSLPHSPEERMRRAFKVAEESLGIPQLLDVEDVCGHRPDERSVMTYVAQYFHAFSSTAQTETESKVISTFVDNMSSLMIAVNDYEERVGRLLSSLSSLLSHWSSTPPSSSSSYSVLLSLRTDLATYRQTDKPEWSRARTAVEELLLNIQTKLQTYGLSGYEPGEEVCLATIENKWGEVLDAELQRRMEINRAIRQIQNDARRRFADQANALQLQIADQNWELINLSGSLESQLHRTTALLSSLPTLSSLFPPLKLAEQACIECHANEEGSNDWTVHSVEELEGEFESLERRMRERKAFVEHQMIARKTTTVSPKDLEEFDSAFRSFDKEALGRLDLDQLSGALGALGVAEIDLDEIQAQVGDEVTYEEFIQFMVARSEERPTGEKVRSCFRSTAGGKPYITELDLRRLDLPASAIQFLLERIERYEPGEDGDVAEEEREGALDYEAFLRMFMEGEEGR